MHDIFIWCVSLLCLQLDEDKLENVLSGKSEEEKAALAEEAAAQIKEKLRDVVEDFDEVVGDCLER